MKGAYLLDFAPRILPLARRFLILMFAIWTHDVNALLGWSSLIVPGFISDPCRLAVAFALEMLLLEVCYLPYEDRLLHGEVCSLPYEASCPAHLFYGFIFCPFCWIEEVTRDGSR